MRNDFIYDINYLENFNNKDDLYITQKDNVFVLGMGLTSRCNLKCPKCYYGSSHNENRDLPLEIVKEILTSCSHLKNINIALEGEPFCYPKISDVFNYSMECSDSISISTNGTYLTKSLIKDLENFKFNIFSMSIDSPIQKYYEIFHKGGSFNKFIDNASSVVDVLGDKAIFTTVLYRQNIDKIDQLPGLAKKIGINFINLMQLREHNYCIENGLSAINEEDLLKNLHLIIDSAIKYDVKLLFDEYFAKPRIMDELKSINSNNIVINKSYTKLKCNYPWHYTSILSNGYIFPCCGDFKPEKILEYTFDGIFNHKYLRTLRGILSSKQFPSICKQCHFMSNI